MHLLQVIHKQILFADSQILTRTAATVNENQGKKGQNNKACPIVLKEWGQNVGLHVRYTEWPEAKKKQEKQTGKKSQQVIHSPGNE